MDWLPENWTPVLNALRRGRRVVPVIGEALQLIPDEQGKPTPFVRILARRLFASYSEAERATVLEALGKKQSHAAEPSLHDLAVPFISRPMKGTSGNLISPGEAFAGLIHEPCRRA